MSTVAATQPQLLSQINERSVLRALQTTGPCSRADLTRQLGVTAPTVSKAVANLLRSSLLEEFDAVENSRGRPARRLRLATENAQILGLVMDASICRLVSAGLDGVLHPTRATAFAPPATYDELLDTICEQASALIDRDGVTTLGLGISMPGLIDARTGQGLLSPNLPITDGHSPGLDLAERLALETVLVQECDALCLAERHFGDAKTTDNFAILDGTVGLGLGVFTDGQLQAGSGGYAGEIGHLPIVADGAPCGCGRRGCLETLACDAAFERRLTQRLGRPCSIDELCTQGRTDDPDVAVELSATLSHLAFAATTVINLFNPERLYVCSRLFDLGDDVLPRLIDETAARALRPSFDDCTIQHGRGSKPEGAIAAIIEHLTNSRIQTASSNGNGVTGQHRPNSQSSLV